MAKQSLYLKFKMSTSYVTESEWSEVINVNVVVTESSSAGFNVTTCLNGRVMSWVKRLLDGELGVFVFLEIGVYVRLY
ncbi:unnamed protein product [Colias eurytheme]|nr:unnamed protein product [Colias eurytheme]